MDLGRLRALGLGAISLRTLVLVRQLVGLVAGSGVGLVPSVLGSCLRVVLGRRLRVWLGLGWLGRLRLAPDRALRLVPSVVGWIPRPVWRGRLPWQIWSFRRLRTSAWR